MEGQHPEAAAANAEKLKQQEEARCNILEQILSLEARERRTFYCCAVLAS